MRLQRNPALPPSVRAAMAAVSELNEPCDTLTIDAVMAGFALRRTTWRRWWSEPCEWLGGDRPIVVLRRGEGHTVLMAVSAALVAMLEMLAADGEHEAVAIVADRLRCAGAPRAIIDAAAALASVAAVTEGAANDA
jgi:hypothetical protein